MCIDIKSWLWYVIKQQQIAERYLWYGLTFIKKFLYVYYMYIHIFVFKCLEKCLKRSPSYW